jgi:hypothetical protein
VQVPGGIRERRVERLIRERQDRVRLLQAAAHVGDPRQAPLRLVDVEGVEHGGTGRGGGAHPGPIDRIPEQRRGEPGRLGRHGRRHEHAVHQEHVGREAPHLGEEVVPVRGVQVVHADLMVELARGRRVAADGAVPWRHGGVRAVLGARGGDLGGEIRLLEDAHSVAALHEGADQGELGRPVARGV